MTGLRCFPVSGEQISDQLHYEARKRHFSDQHHAVSPDPNGPVPVGLASL